jgi:hypothetical protein
MDVGVFEYLWSGVGYWVSLVICFSGFEVFV